MKKLVLFVAVFGLMQLFATAQEMKQQRSITVTGSASIELIPDEIYVQVELKEYEKKNNGKIDIENIKNSFLANYKKLGLPDSNITVQQMQGWDNRQWWNKKKKDPNMMASITYQIKLSSTRQIDELVNFLDDEATQNFFIAKVSHSKINEYRKQLKIEAIKAAKVKAGYLSEAIGEKVGQAITIVEPNEINLFPPQPRMYANSMMKTAEMDNSVNNMQVDFKKIKIEFEVSVTFALQ